MTDMFPVLRVLGMLVMIFASSLALPMAVSWWTRDGVLFVYPLSMAATAFVGAWLWWSFRVFRRELQPRHGVMLVSLVWLLLPLFAALPLMLAGHFIGRPLSFTHAYFEAVSGLTTTGSTVMSGLDALPVSVNVWRTFLQWLGGMAPLDAVMHMFTTVSLGGLSPYDASFGHFQSPLLEAIAVVFMLVASCNFALYFVAFRKGDWRGFWRDPELRATLGTLIVGGLVVSLLLWAKGVYEPLTALRHGMFNVVSLASTTGYATVDYLGWPVFAPVLMLLLSGVATSAGSTGCGIKMVRMLILVKQARREMTRLVHPRAVQPVCLGDAVVDNRVIFSVLAFMLVYGATVIGLSMVLLLTDLDPVTAFSAVLASVNCAGPGLGPVGPASNFSVLTDLALIPL